MAEHIAEAHSAYFAEGDASPEGGASVYLFGSEADGRAHRESDVGVGLLLDSTSSSLSS